MTTYIRDQSNGVTIAAADADAPGLLLSPALRLASAPEIAEYLAAVGNSEPTMQADIVEAPDTSVVDPELQAGDDATPQADGTVALTEHEGV
jgi:hypothetical protein